MAAGLAGISPGRDDDIKCCHAQLADWLLRARAPRARRAASADDASTRVGAEVARVLRERGVDLSGCGACREQCAGCGASAEDAGAPAWSYTPVKNKMSPRRTAKNRRIERERAAAPATRRAMPRALMRAGAPGSGVLVVQLTSAVLWRHEAERGGEDGGTTKG